MRISTEKLQILYYPDQILRCKCLAVTQINDQIRQVVCRMIELMHEARGVGLAAPQVGLNWRMFVANPTNEPDKDYVFINPVLSKPGKVSAAHEEGCLSIPGVYGQITRPVSITIEAMNESGESVQMTADDIAARVWQHETDHLDGVLIIDKMTPMDKMANKRLLRDLEEIAKQA